MGYSQLYNNQEKTQSITFRLPKRILEQLELESRQSNVSENVLVKQILTNYVDWTRFSNGIGLLPITRDSFKKLTQNLDINDIMALVDDMFSLIKNFAMIKHGYYDQKSAVESLSLYLRASNLSLVHMKEEKDHRFLVKHDLGINFSLIMEELFKRIFDEFIHDDKIRFKTSDDSMIASIILDLDFSENTTKKRV